MYMKRIQKKDLQALNAQNYTINSNKSIYCLLTNNQKLENNKLESIIPLAFSSFAQRLFCKVFHLSMLCYFSHGTSVTIIVQRDHAHWLDRSYYFSNLYFFLHWVLELLTPSVFFSGIHYCKPLPNVEGLCPNPSGLAALFVFWRQKTLTSMYWLQDHSWRKA